METLINKIKALQNDGRGPCDESIEFLESCKTPQEALDKAYWDYLEWLLNALGIDYSREDAEFDSKCNVIGAEYESKLGVLRADYWANHDVIKDDDKSKIDALDGDYYSKRDVLRANYEPKRAAVLTEYTDSLRKLVVSQLLYFNEA